MPNLTVPEMLLFWPLAVVLAGLAIVGVIKLFEGTLTRDTGFADDYRKFMDDTRARGLSYHEACQEWAVRTAFVRLRREATTAVMANPKAWKAELDQCVQDAFNRLAVENPDVLPHFGAMVRGLSYGDILYPIATKLVDKDIMDCPVLVRPSIDQRAALRVIK